MRVVWRVVAGPAVALGLLLSGCGDEVGMKNTITEQQAYDKVEDYIQQTATALPAEARLEISGQADSLACDDPTDNGPKGRVTVGSVYWVRGIANESKHFDAVLEWWEAHDFVVLEDLRPDRNRVWVENRKDGFRMAFRDNPKGELLLGADSPCVWPNGTPAPE